MNYSQVAAKVSVRLFFVLLLAAMVVFLQGDTDKLKHLYLAPKQVYMLAFPVLLVLGFITLLILCATKKYSRVDLNWLLVLNTVVLIIYGATLFFAVKRLIG